MGSTHALIGCLAFILGLLLTAIPYGGWILFAIATLTALLLHRIWKTPIRPHIWFVAGAIGLVATGYFHLRLPQPASTDISRLLSSTEQSVQVLVEGTVLSLPRLTRSEKAQFWLRAQTIAPIGDGKPVTGNVYTTVPADQATILHPGQVVKVSGGLYLPDVALNPGGFNFQNYLRQEDSFAGIRGEQVELLQQSSGWGWWQIQQRIVQAQRQSLGTPEGALVSAMVLGGRAVDLPYEVKDAFARVGLAHALAASGFQTSLILGVVLALTRRAGDRIQFIAGTAALGLFVGLAGCQPAVLRAAVMGFGGLVALVLKRQIKPLGSLLVTAVILLLIKPLWIWDLGFQFSFLATIGLLVTVPALDRRLDWLPPAIVPLITVPIAAYLWTVPLQLGEFGVLSPYSIPANLVTTPFISVISLGGMVSALGAIVWLDGGSALAWFLKYPTQLLIAIVNGFSQLPGNGLAIGTVSVLIVLTLYALLILTTIHQWWQKRWWIAFIAGVVLVLVPVGISTTTTQAMVLATSRQPMLVLRDRGRVLVIGGGDRQTGQFTLLPYLQQAGVNQIDWAIATNAQAAKDWIELSHRFPVRYLLQPPVLQVSSTATSSPNSQTTLIPLELNQTVKVGAAEINLLSLEPRIMQFSWHQQTWLWLDRLTAAEQKVLLASRSLPQTQVLWWSGKSIDPKLVQAVKPTVAIASSAAIDSETAQLFQKQNISAFVTGADGAIKWTPGGGFSSILENFTE